MLLIVSRFLIPNGYRGMALFPFVILRDAADRDNAVLLNHERIHLRQQLELLVIPFYFWYFGDYVVKFLLYGDRAKAYRNIIFEREAYANEGNATYLATRRTWRFLKYFSPAR